MSEMLNSKEMQDLLQVDRSTIYRMAEAGRLPAIKVGKQWRFPKNQVHDWLQTQGSSTPVIIEQPLPQAQPKTTSNGSSKLVDLLPIDCVQPIQDTFADALGIMVIITDLDGNPVTEVSNPCGLFTAISDHPNALQKCLENWRSMAHTIDLEPKFIPSHLGLLCSRAMIRVGHELKGMVFVGGIAPENWPPTEEQLNAIAAEFGVSPELMVSHIEEVFYMSNNEQAHVLPFVQRIANIVAHILNERKDFVGKLDAIAQLTR